VSEIRIVAVLDDVAGQCVKRAAESLRSHRGDTLTSHPDISV
jgi:hypothetical protein